MYKIKDEYNATKLKLNGENYLRVLKLLKFRFDDNSVDIINDNVVKNIYSKISTLEQPRNLLIVGKVQSGKTANLELLSGLLFDNDYRVGVIYGGYDNTLLNQTIERFRSSFNSQDIIIISSFEITPNHSSQLKTLLENKNKKIIFITIKNSNGIDKITEVIKNLDGLKSKLFIIDDEGDQASLNTEFKKSKISATYESISSMMMGVEDPLYLSVTATPQANILQPYFSKITPKDATILMSGPKYYGANKFHIEYDKIIEIPEHVRNNEAKANIYIMNSVNYYILTSAILRKRENINKTRMIIHTTDKNIEHNKIKVAIDKKIHSYSDYISKREQQYVFKEFENTYNKYDMSKYNISFDELKEGILEIIRFLNVIEYNSQGDPNNPLLDHLDYVVHIGGNLLQRGMTFDNLVTVYFSRFPKGDSNVDTTLQRARWFGYREKTFKYTKIFTTKEISETFMKLADFENELFHQLDQVSKGIETLENIEFYLDEGLRPSRENVIDVNKKSISSRWYSQKLILGDVNIVKELNKLVDDFISKKSFVKISDGSNNNITTGKITNISAEEFDEFKKSISNCYQGPLEIVNNYKYLNEKYIDIILMKNLDRTRTIDNDGNITVLQQGADSVDKKLQTYKGDRYVIKNNDRITVQIHKVSPIKDKKVNHELQQYMFSIYIPNTKNVYKRR